MSLSISTLSSLILANLESKGAKGKNRQKLSLGVATGIVNSIVGKTFTTNDSGQISGTGTGAGVGITSLSAPTMATTALNLMFSKGRNAEPLMTSITSAVVTHLASATLSSTHTPVYQGTGVVVAGSISVDANEMSDNIFTALQKQGAKGKNLRALSDCLGHGIAPNIANNGSGTVTITGSGSSGTGTGHGTGTIS